jgi:magnesium transporter
LILLPRLIKRRSKSRGLALGDLVHIGEKKIEKVRISVIDYSADKFEEKEIKNVEDCFQFKRKLSVTWINVDGLHDVEAIEKFKIMLIMIKS